MCVDEEFFFRESLLGAAQELIVKGYPVVEIRLAIFDDEVTAVLSPKAIGTFEHGGEDNERDEHHFLVMSDGAVSKGIVLHLVAGTFVGECVSEHKMCGVHHTHNGNVNRHVMRAEMGLHGV